MNSPFRRRVALTFDDGPNSEYSLQILDILKSHNSIKAAFFFPGKNVEREPDTALRVKQEGHDIGNHSYSHPHLNRLSPADCAFEVERTEKVFKDLLGIKPRFFRPPYGEYNLAIERFITAKGYKLVLWDMKCYSMDWMGYSARRIADVSTQKARDGSIILLHDGRNIQYRPCRRNTVKALGMIIEILEEKGFEIVPLNSICEDWKEL
ncbi:MAG: polysaccharide deacetylase family protein [Candidatus Omnitrophica bacterium]|nr:polysaccharide deacetylase family protein [Candidatus Omnitrophota bacterium]